MITGIDEDHVGSRKAMLIDLLNRSAKFEDEDLRAQQELRLSRAIDILEKMREKSVGIRTNQNLSEKGVQEQLRQLAKDTLAALGPFFKEAETADATYIRAYGQLLKVPEAPEGRSELAVLMREQEIRTWLRTLALPSLMHTYIAAVRDNDVELIRALRNAPGSALLPPDFIERVARDHVKTTQNDKLIRLEGLDILRQELRDVSNILKTWLMGYEPVTFPTPSIKQAPASMAAR
jgi:hypothetical protein